MSQFQWNQFDAENTETPSHDPLPAGNYTVAITESEMTPNKAGSGEFLKLTMSVIEGEHEGRLLFTRLNLVHPNEKAVAIAKSELAAICKAVGVMKPQDSSDLHGKAFSVRVTQIEKDGQIYNEVKSFGPAGTAQPTAPAASKPATNPTQTAATAGKATPPWKKK